MVAVLRYLPGNYLNLLLEGGELPQPSKLYSEKDMGAAFEKISEKLRKGEDWQARMQVRICSSLIYGIMTIPHHLHSHIIPCIHSPMIDTCAGTI